jgi:hypothetical protein
MWSLLPKRTQVVVILAAGFAIAWAVDALWAMGGGEKPGVLKTISLCATVIGFALVPIANFLFARLWRRIPFLEARTFPDLSGVWTGTLVSTWVDPATGKTPDPIPTDVTIRMTLFKTTVSLKTRESWSHSTRAILEAFPDERRFRVWYSYNNDPQAQFQHRSSPHEGVAYLDVHHEEDRNKLTGRYYTARKTTGDMTLFRDETSS